MIRSREAMAVLVIIIDSFGETFLLPFPRSQSAGRGALRYGVTCTDSPAVYHLYDRYESPPSLIPLIPSRDHWSVDVKPHEKQYDKEE